MRRKDREITSRDEVVDVLARCDTLRMGLRGDAYPYVVPVSFGFDASGERVVIYAHCAREGMKLDLIRHDPHVCVEGDVLHRIERTSFGITARYESVIGFGVCEEVHDEAETCRGLRLINEHYGQGDFPLESCKSCDCVRVLKITLESISGKRSISHGEREEREA